LPIAAYRDIAPREAFYSRVLDEARALPGVRGAGFISFLPISSMRGGIWPVLVEGDVEGDLNVRRANNVAGVRVVTPGYFEAIGIPFKRGRVVSDADTPPCQPVAVVSESFVKRYWPDQDPIGRRFTVGELKDREVVGVAGDVKFRGLERI